MHANYNTDLLSDDSLEQDSDWDGDIVTKQNSQHVMEIIILLNKFIILFFCIDYQSKYLDALFN